MNLSEQLGGVAALQEIRTRQILLEEFQKYCNQSEKMDIALFIEALFKVKSYF